MRKWTFRKGFCFHKSETARGNDLVSEVSSSFEADGKFIYNRYSQKFATALLDIKVQPRKANVEHFVETHRKCVLINEKECESFIFIYI